MELVAMEIVVIELVARSLLLRSLLLRSKSSAGTFRSCTIVKVIQSSVSLPA